MRSGAAVIGLLLIACGEAALAPDPAPVPAPAPAPSPTPTAPEPFPRTLPSPLDASSFFPHVGDAWVRASTSPGVAPIASAITRVTDDGISELATTNGPGRVRATADELAYVDGRGNTIEVWLHTPLVVGTSWRDRGWPLGCESTITEGPHESELFGRPLPACITVRAECRGHDTGSIHLDTWCVGLGRVRSEITETAGYRGAQYTTSLVAFATGAKQMFAPPAPEASPPYDEASLSGLLATVRTPLP